MAKLSRKRAESAALWAIAMHLVGAGVTIALASWTHTPSTAILMWLVLLGIPFWLLTLLHARQHRLAELEEADWERLLAERKAGGGQGKLFEVEEGEAFLMRKRLHSLERIWLPVGSLLIFILLGGIAFLHILVFRKLIPVAVDPDPAVISATVLVVQAFLLFLYGMYTSGMARESIWRHVRAGASYMMFSAAATGAVIIVLILHRVNIAKADIYVAFVLAAAMILVALEVLLNFVMNIYRPRLPNVEVRFAYDSRLLELITSPGGILRTAASTLDYQFGFKVSETWFYRFIERAIAPIVLFQIIAFYLLTTIVIVGPDQKVIIERFGKPRAIELTKDSAGEPIVVGGALEPGLHFKWPWPFEAVYRHPAAQIHSVLVGYTQDEADKDKLWTVKHFENEGLVLVATAKEAMPTASYGDANREAPPPVNLMASNLAVQYRVKNKPLVPLDTLTDPKAIAAAREANAQTKKENDQALYDYVYTVEKPDALLQMLASREMARYMATVDFFKAMCTEREKVGSDLKGLIQDAADNALGPKKGLGVEIVFVGLEGVHPPVEAGDAFEDVIAAQENKQQQILKADAQAIEATTTGRHQANSVVAGSIAYRYDRGVSSQSDAQRFEKQLLAYNAAPGVYEIREYLSALEDVSSKLRKYVVAAKGWDTSVIRLNLEEAQSSTLLDQPSYGKPPGTENNQNKESTGK